MQLRYAYHESVPTSEINGMNHTVVEVNMDEVKVNSKLCNLSGLMTIMMKGQELRLTT